MTGAAPRHGLQGHQAEGLIAAGEHRRIGQVVQAVPGEIIHIACKQDLFAQTQLPGLPLQVIMAGPIPGDDELGLGTVGQHLGSCGQEQIHPFSKTCRPT